MPELANQSASPAYPKCPSAQPGMSAPVAIGVASYDGDTQSLAYLDHPITVTPELLQLTAGIPPGRVFRIAATCEAHRCAHFDGRQCRLAERIIQLLPIVVDQLPACSIRSECRWFAEQGPAACRRCPQIVTLSDADEPLILQAALGPPAVRPLARQANASSA